MKIVMMAALVAAQLAAAAGPTQAAELARVETAAQERTSFPGERLGQEVELSLADGRSQPPRIDGAGVSARGDTAREDRPRKGKSTGDKVLTGAAVILGVGALAVGGLLVAIFVN